MEAMHAAPIRSAPPPRSQAVRPPMPIVGAVLAAALAGCVVVPARPVGYHPVVVRPYVFAVY
jgi:hypothetical protein